MKMPGTLANTTYLQTAPGAGLPSVFKTDASNSWTAGGWFRITATSDQQWLLHTRRPDHLRAGRVLLLRQPGRRQAVEPYGLRVLPRRREGVDRQLQGGRHGRHVRDRRSRLRSGRGQQLGPSDVSLQRDDNQLSILVGGVTQASTIDVAHQVSSGPGPFMIGCNESWGCSLTGNTDEVFFATSALSDVDVHRIYACGIDGSRCRCNGTSFSTAGSCSRPAVRCFRGATRRFHDGPGDRLGASGVCRLSARRLPLTAMDEPSGAQVLAGKYKLVHQLGKGGMGSVWLADHLTLQSPVAIKLIDPAIASNPEALARFMREARAAAALRSPHVVQILDHGVDGTASRTSRWSCSRASRWRRGCARSGSLSPEATARIVTHIGARARARTRPASSTAT